MRIESGHGQGAVNNCGQWVIAAILIVSMLSGSGCRNTEAARRKAGVQLQERMEEIDDQYQNNMITLEQKAELERQAIEQHKIRWNKIGDPDQIYGPVIAPRGAGMGYRNF